VAFSLIKVLHHGNKGLALAILKINYTSTCKNDVHLVEYYPFFLSQLSSALGEMMMHAFLHLNYSLKCAVLRFPLIY